MQCTRSIGLADIVAAMASHRSASKRNEQLEPTEFDRIAAYLRNNQRSPAPNVQVERRRRFAGIQPVSAPG